jgi:hypothetical protein
MKPRFPAQASEGFRLECANLALISPALPDFLRSSGSGTGSTQPRENN